MTVVSAPALAATVLAALLLAAPAAAAVRKPSLQAKAAIVVAARSGEVLLAERADERRPVASATKLMTALLALERSRPGDVLAAADYRPAPVESQIGLRPGERIRVRDLLAALLLESANDAAVTLAERLSGSREAFVEDMNERARELGLTRTRYANPIGLDDPANYSSARDLARLARRLMGDPRFRAVVDLPQARLHSGARVRTVENRNGLVRRHPFVDGIKTGHTSAAGYVLVGSATRRGTRVISVVLGEPSEAAREADSLALMRFGLDQFVRRTALRGGVPLARVAVRYRDGESAALTTPTDVRLTIRRGERLTRRVTAPEEIEGPLPAGARAGSVSVIYRGRAVRTVPLVTAKAVPGVSMLRKLTSDFVPLTAVLVLAMLTVAGLGAMRLRARARRPAGARR